VTKVLCEKRDRIAFVTINRPEAKNAIDPETHELLWRTWEDFAEDGAVDVAILTGAGDAFCAGADNVKTGIGGLTRGLHRIYKPTIAAVNGWALAGGLETALACDIRIASDTAL
jgi:enoyl-CoA hydratase/carnithine racemase